MRPIVASIDSPSYGTSKHIAQLIAPLAGHTPSFVKDSSELKRFIVSESISESETMVSFDVSSLFTNVPVEESVGVIRDMLELDDTLEDRTPLTPERITELLGMCLRSTYFSYGGDFYQQKHGAAMGSPVSAVVANLYMEFFEELLYTPLSGLGSGNAMSMIHSV